MNTHDAKAEVEEALQAVNVAILETMQAKDEVDQLALLRKISSLSESTDT